MNHEAFTRLVADDVKQRVTPEQASYIRQPENLERWERSLVALLDNLSSQLDDLSRREEIESERYKVLGQDGLGLLAEMQIDVEQRKKKIYRFRHHVEKRLDEASRMLASVGPDPDAEMLEFLRQAIEQHRKMNSRAKLDPTPIDEALWATLHGHWKFDDINIEAVEAEFS